MRTKMKFRRRTRRRKELDRDVVDALRGARGRGLGNGGRGGTRPRKT